MRMQIVVSALCLFVVFLLQLAAALQAMDFVRYMTPLPWNQALEVCHQQGMDLAFISKFSREFLHQAFSAQPQHNSTDNLWIGLHDAAQSPGRLGSVGYVWSHNCKLLQRWNDWATGEPQDRGDNWCVQLLGLQELRWGLQQCSSPRHFLCFRRIGGCNKFVDSLEAGCDLSTPASKDLSPIVQSHSETEENCSATCVEYQSSYSRCWMYTYDATQGGCVLHVGLSPIYCGENSTFTAAAAGTTTATTRMTRSRMMTTDSWVAGSSATVFWVRDCYSVSYNYSTELKVTAGNLRYALDGCIDPMNNTNWTTVAATGTMASEAPSSTTTVTETPVSGTSAPDPRHTTALLSSRPETTGQMTSASASPATATEAPNSGTTASESQHTTTDRNSQTTSSHINKNNKNKNSSSSSDNNNNNNNDNDNDDNDQLHRCCRCVLRKPNAVNISKATEAAEDLRRELTLNKSNLSSTRRRKETAADNRPSALATGGVGIVMMVIGLCLIVVPDLLTLYRRAKLTQHTATEQGVVK